MIHTYQISGMTCQGCEATVRSALLLVDHVESVNVSQKDSTATISMDKHIGLPVLQKALGGKFGISAEQHNETAEQAKSWLVSYKPVLLIFLYLFSSTLIIQLSGQEFHLMQWMQHFMGGFFLVFSFFKLLNLEGFAESYRMYDIVAKRLFAWPYMYAFIELGLGIAYLANVNLFITNLVTIIIMSISIIGVVQSVLNKRKIQCACLGVVFNLPMSTITIIEDGLMIAMGLVMLFML